MKKLSGLILMQEQMERNLNTAFEKSFKAYNSQLSEMKQDNEYFLLSIQNPENGKGIYFPS
ncbi:MAG: hypothetical protein IPH77_20805 [Ignavibacteria bacterium]|nr:hypothetical protein [Ignavibacteria bacterium]